MFTDEQWERIEPLLPSSQGRRGHPFGKHRRVVGSIACRYRTGIPVREVSDALYGPRDAGRAHGPVAGRRVVKERLSVGAETVCTVTAEATGEQSQGCGGNKRLRRAGAAGD